MHQNTFRSQLNGTTNRQPRERPLEPAGRRRTPKSIEPACSRQACEAHIERRRQKSGAGGSRTLVQTKRHRTFYMLSFRSSFRESCKHENKRQLSLSSEFRGNSSKPFCPLLLSFFDKRHAVYQVSSVRPRGFLIYPD